jgi:hypothetical protein
VHTRLGSFLPPATTPSLTTHSAPSLFPPHPSIPGRNYFARPAISTAKSRHGEHKLSDDSSSLTFNLSLRKRRVTKLNFPHQPLFKTQIHEESKCCWKSLNFGHYLENSMEKNAFYKEIVRNNKLCDRKKTILSKNLININTDFLITSNMNGKQQYDLNTDIANVKEEDFLNFLQFQILTSPQVCHFRIFPRVREWR